MLSPSHPQEERKTAALTYSACRERNPLNGTRTYVCVCDPPTDEHATGTQGAPCFACRLFALSSFTTDNGSGGKWLLVTMIMMLHCLHTEPHQLCNPRTSVVWKRDSRPTVPPVYARDHAQSVREANLSRPRLCLEPKRLVLEPRMWPLC